MAAIARELLSRDQSGFKHREERKAARTRNWPPTGGGHKLYREIAAKTY